MTPRSDARGRPLRAWPALVLVAAMALTRELPGLVEEPPQGLWMVSGFGPAIGGLLVLLWWVLASRATRFERLAGLLGLVIALGLAVLLAHPTVRGPVTVGVTAPLGLGAFGIAAALASSLGAPRRTFLALGVAALAFGSTTLLRNEGMGGNFRFALRARWVPTHEERMLETAAADEVASAPAEAFDLADPAWPGFRGRERASHADGTRVGDDWATHPPELLWRVDLGPAWSSFAVAGGHLYTQEQRGPLEATICLRASDGERVWMDTSEGRFEDPLGGPGPRATPTLAGDALYAQGANGRLACLDARTGAVRWEADVARTAGREPPPWGFASSPLVVGEVVVVHAGGAEDRGTLAFERASGALAWSAPAGDHSYASPQVVRLLGAERVCMLTNAGLDVLDPATGAVLLAYAWPYGQYRALQPHALDDDELLLPTGVGVGTRRLRVADGGAAWTAEEVWTSRDLKGDFNDFVTHGGHAYGFDGSILACIDLATGARAWKRGRYGTGQVLLLADEDRLLVSADDGRVVLLEASPAGHEEVAELQALEGKTWNHPVVVGDRLYVRNAREAAAFAFANAPGG